MKKLLVIIIFILLIGNGCSNKTIDLNKAIQKEPDTGSFEFIPEDKAVEMLRNDPSIKAIESKGVVVDISEREAPTKEEPFWRISLKDTNSGLLYHYILNGFTGEILAVNLEDVHEEDEEIIKKEMQDTVLWVFENWQSFKPDSYDPAKYGLAFSINFRLSYIFDNYDENMNAVLEQKIESQTRVLEIKDAAAVYDEEDHTFYAQLRVVVQYEQIISGKEYNEPVEVLIFSKNQLDSDEGWQITNVDMYPIETTGKDFDQLFFGFTK